MESAERGDIFSFEGFRLDRRGGGLFQRDETGILVPVPIGPRALDVLGVLVERAGDLVTRDEIIAAVWPQTVVEDNNLNMQIAALRRVLDPGRPPPGCIQTIPRRGYRFVAPVTRPAAATQSAPAESSPARDAGHGDHRSSPTSLPQYRVRRAFMACVAAALVLAVAGAIAWKVELRWFADARSAPPLSIVVLPFANLGGDPGAQSFADGITEDLTTDLSRLADMRVISHDTAFTYKYNPVSAERIGR